MALFLDAEPGDEIRIGQSVVRIERKSGQKARLRIESTEDVHHTKPGDEPEQPAAPAFTRAPRPPSG